MPRLPNPATTYIALLRGINVGGNNIIKMTALKASFEHMGFRNVRTVIASGNVLFEARGSAAMLATKIEKALSSEFAYIAHVVVLSEAELKSVVKGAPRGFGTEPAKYRYDVMFVRPPLTPEKAMAAVELKEGVDDAHAGDHAIYFRRLIARVTASRINKIVGTPAYKSMTIRNWNTTTKLAALLEKES